MQQRINDLLVETYQLIADIPNTHFCMWRWEEEPSLLLDGTMSFECHTYYGCKKGIYFPRNSVQTTLNAQNLELLVAELKKFAETRTNCRGTSGKSLGRMKGEKQ